MKFTNVVMLVLLLAFTNLQAGQVLTPEEVARAEASSRISPVLSNILVRKVGDPTYNVIISGFEPGDYLVEWTVVAYDEGNTTSYLAAFDCRGADSGQCGNAYGDSTRFIDYIDGGGELLSDGTSTWSYRATNGITVYAKDFVYKTTITIRSEGAGQTPWNRDNPSPIVIRWYQKSKQYQDLGAGSISILLGTLSELFYDPNARRIETFVPPVAP